MTDVRVGVDVGGTFTDVVLAAKDYLETAKVPTTDNQSEGVIAGIQKACTKADIDPATIDRFIHGMTVSTNALLEQNGAKTALITTEGFRDVLEIGRQDRPSLYDLDVDRPTPLVPRRRRHEISERSTTERVVESVDPDEVRDIVASLDDDVQSIAVSLLHAYAHPENEQAVVDILREETTAHVSASHEVLAEFREFERTSTTVVDAYVTPAIDRYLGRLVTRAEEMNLPEPSIMQSNGGIASVPTVRDNAVTTALSGPAAGVVGASAVTGSDADLITFDMGGTSCDVSLIRDGQATRTTDVDIGGYPIAVPMVDVNTVGAGGGSVAWVDEGGALRVGPQSAGANPGPACYGKGGELPTVTDANVVLGYIGSDSALGGELTIDTDAAKEAVNDVADQAGLEDSIEAARGIYRIVNAAMTRAIRTMTVERGYDPREFGLVAFGGAGPLHATAIAEELDITRVVIPYASGVLSAQGLTVAQEKHDTVRTYRDRLSDLDLTKVSEQFEEIEADLSARVETDDLHFQRAVDLRYAGQSFELTIDIDNIESQAELRSLFKEAYTETYGYSMDDPIELVNLRVTAVGEPPSVETTVDFPKTDARIGARKAMIDGSFVETPVFDRSKLSPGQTISGPAILEQDESTTLVLDNWSGIVRQNGTLELTKGDQHE